MLVLVNDICGSLTVVGFCFYGKRVDVVSLSLAIITLYPNVLFFSDFIFIFSC